MGAVTQLMPIDRQATSSTVPVTFNWSATDASGIAAYVVYVKTDGGDWVLRTDVPSTATTYTLLLSYGHTYQVAVKAKDPAGNLSSYSYDTVAPSVFDDTDFSSVSSPWTRYSLDRLGRRVVHRGFQRRRVRPEVVHRSRHRSGRAEVREPQAASPSRATAAPPRRATSTARRRSAATSSPPATSRRAARHTIKVTAEGTSGRPWLAMDAFAILS